jgi:hypothetical protein
MANGCAVVMILMWTVGMGVSAADSSPKTKTHRLRFTIRLHDGSPAAGAFVSVNGCATPDSFAESWEGDGPLFDQPTTPWPHHESYSVFTTEIYFELCHVMAKADSSGQLVLPYSGTSHNIVLLATISHPAGKAQTMVKLLRGNHAVNVRMKRGATSNVTISCGTNPCEPTNVELTVRAANMPTVVANRMTDGMGLASFVGIPDGTASVRVTPSVAGTPRSTWDADIRWPVSRRPLHIKIPTDAPTYDVIVEASRKPGLASTIRAGVTCQLDAAPGIVYRPPPPTQVVVSDGVTFTFSDLRGTCMITASQQDNTFVNPKASVTVSGAGKVALRIR